MTYDPSKTYQWTPQDVFSLEGMEFEYVFNFVSEFLAKPSSQEVLKMSEMHKILQSKLEKAIEEGKVKSS